MENKIAAQIYGDLRKLYGQDATMVGPYQQFFRERRFEEVARNYPGYKDLVYKIGYQVYPDDWDYNRGTNHLPALDKKFLTFPAEGGGGGDSGPRKLNAQELQQVQADYDAEVNMIKKAYNNGILDYDDMMEGIETSRRNLRKSLESGLSQNRGYFASISPNAYQNVKQRYDTDVRDAYEEGLGVENKNQKALERAKGLYDIKYKNALTRSLREKDALMNQGKVGDYFKGGGGFSSQMGGYSPTQVSNIPAANSAGLQGGVNPYMPQEAPSISNYNAGGDAFSEFVDKGRL